MLASVPSPHIVLALASLLAVTPVHAEALRAQGEGARQVHALKFDWTRDGIITGSAAVLWIGSEAFLKKELAPNPCRWCDRDAEGRDTLNRLDRWGRGLAGSTQAARDRADSWSNILDFGVLPAGVLGAQALLVNANGADSRIYFQDAGIILETTMLAAVFNQTVKFIVGRERPFVHQLPEDQKGLVEHASDNNLSFYSGHTNLMFAMVVSAGTVASLRGYDHQGWIWAVGLPLATSVGLLRMGADKHYLTDVATGAVLGSAFGLAVPLLLHGRTDTTQAAQRTGGGSVRMMPMAGAHVAGISGVF
jgi:membrane-associated phospholipid phosphatase